MTNDDKALLPCPFCNAQLEVREHSAFHPSSTAGNKCWLATAGEHASPYELGEYEYESWNRRAGPSAPAETPRYTATTPKIEEALQQGNRYAALVAAKEEIGRLTSELEAAKRERDAIKDRLMDTLAYSKWQTEEIEENSAALAKAQEVVEKARNLKFYMAETGSGKSVTTVSADRARDLEKALSAFLGGS